MTGTATPPTRAHRAEKRYIYAWGDGHASWRRKGSLIWCRDVSSTEPDASCPQ